MPGSLPCGTIVPLGCFVCPVSRHSRGFVNVHVRLYGVFKGWLRLWYGMPEIKREQSWGSGIGLPPMNGEIQWGYLEGLAV